jgi:glutamine synthetase
VIEANMMVHMAKGSILPAAIRYQSEVAQAVNATKAAGVDNAAQADLLRSLTATITDFQKSIAALEKAVGHHAAGDAFDHAKHTREQIVPAMAELRKLGDKLETIVADDIWPLPTYREMLFIK